MVRRGEAAEQENHRQPSEGLVEIVHFCVHAFPHAQTSFNSLIVCATHELHLRHNPRPSSLSEPSSTPPRHTHAQCDLLELPQFEFGLLIGPLAQSLQGTMAGLRSCLRFHGPSAGKVELNGEKLRQCTE